MDATSVFLGRKLLERISDQRESYLGPLIAGQMTDYAHYRERAGYLRALEDVERWVSEIRLDREKEERGGAFGPHQAGPRPAA
jgi:hypothetical protein